MHLLLSGPWEVLVQIIDNLPQLIALVLTCKRLHSVWTANAETKTWQMGELNIVAFDDALKAVSRPELFPLLALTCARYAT